MKGITKPGAVRQSPLSQGQNGANGVANGVVVVNADTGV